jgi:hypothetical protein
MRRNRADSADAPPSAQAAPDPADSPPSAPEPSPADTGTVKVAHPRPCDQRACAAAGGHDCVAIGAAASHAGPGLASRAGIGRGRLLVTAAMAAAVAVVTADTTYLWDVVTHSLAASLTDPGNTVESVAFSPDGKTLAVGDLDGSTYLRDVATRRVTATLTDPDVVSIVDSVAFSRTA